MQEKDHVDRLEVDVINLSLQMDDVISDIELSELCWLNHKEHICECLECSKKNICMDCRKAEMDYLHSNNLSIKRKCAYLESCKEENK